MCISSGKRYMCLPKRPLLRLSTWYSACVTSATDKHAAATRQRQHTFCTALHSNEVLCILDRGAPQQVGCSYQSRQRGIIALSPGSRIVGGRVRSRCFLPCHFTYVQQLGSYDTPTIVEFVFFAHHLVFVAFGKHDARTRGRCTRVRTLV